MGGAGGGGGIFGEVVFEAEEAFEGVGGFEKVFVFAKGEDGFAGEVEDLEAGFFEEAAEGVGGEHGELELLAGVVGEPIGAAGTEESFEGIEVAALEEVIEGGELVVGGGNDYSVGLSGAEDFGDGGRGIGTDGEGIAHGESEGEVIGGELAQVHDVGNEEGGVFGVGAEGFELGAGLVDHVGGVIDEGGGEAGFENLEAPFAGSAAEVKGGAGGGFGEMRFDGAPGELVVEFPVAVVVDLVLLSGDAVVVFAGGV
jgi:hypothetical protein